MIQDLVFDIKRDFEVIHVQIHNKGFTAPNISPGPGPENDFNDLIDNVPKNHKGYTHDSKHVDNFNGVAALNVSVRDVSDLVDTPVK
jgi:hypothetical protein